MAFPVAPEQGWIRLICQPGDSPDAFIEYEYSVHVSAFVDSVARMAAWGESILPVAPGDHVLCVQLGTALALGGPGMALGVPSAMFGTASIPLRVAAGQTVTVFYAAPNSGGTPGSFSFTPPPPPPTNGYKVVQIAILWICGGILLAILLAALALLVFVMAA